MKSTLRYDSHVNDADLNSLNVTFIIYLIFKL